MRRDMLSLLKWILVRDRKESPGFWSRFRPGLAVVVVVAGLNGACEQRGLYEKFEWADLDHLFRASTSQAAVPDISIVLISDDDYRDMFHARSPLEPAPLIDLVHAVCEFQPQVIGVDIVTVDWKEGLGAYERRRSGTSLAKECNVVWVRDAVEEVTTEPQASLPSDTPYFRLGGVTGYDGPTEGLCAPIPVFDPDEDGVVRRYSTHALAQPSGGVEPRLAPYATLAWALAGGGARQGRCGFADGADKDLATRTKKIRFTGNYDFPRLSASLVLQTVKAPEDRFKQEIRSRLKDKIVILGGSYRYARDRHVTPIGPIFGAELLANAVESEISGHIDDVSPYWSLSVDLIVGTLLLALVTSLRLRLPWALLASSLVSVLGAFLICWVLFNYYGYFLGVFGAMAGVVLGVIAEVVWEPLWHDWTEWRQKFRKQRAKSA
jgi:CHASE2 domain-containing sensor protein